MRKPKKKNLFETNKYLYVEANKDLEYLFVDAEKVELNWKHEKKNYWKVKLTDQSFGSAFDAIAEIANNYEYHFVDVDGSLEGNNVKKIDIYQVSFYLPMYAWGMSDTYLADWLTGYLMGNKDTMHLDTIAGLSEGLNAISKPLYKYVFSLLGDRKTRREGLIDSICCWIKKIISRGLLAGHMFASIPRRDTQKAGDRTSTQMLSLEVVLKMPKHLTIQMMQLGNAKNRAKKWAKNVNTCEFKRNKA